MGIFSKQRSKPAGSVAEQPSQSPLERVLPAIRTETSITQQRLRLEIQGVPPVNFPTKAFAGNLRIALVENFANTMAYIDDQKLAEWGVSFDELLERAIANLQDFDPDGFAFRELKVHGGSMFSGFGSDDYLGARLLTPSYLHRVQLPDLIVAINPNRNVLILADAMNPATVDHAFSDAAMFAEEDGFVSLRPIIGDGTNWQDLVLPEGHPAMESYRRLLTLDHVLQTNTIGPELQRLVGSRLFVEPMVAIEENGLAESVTCWREGQPGLMAKADKVAFVRADPAKEVLYASWTAMQETAGMFLTRSQHGTDRFRVTTFPSPEQLDSMGARPAPHSNEQN